ncbi:hypothetical protein HYV84_07560 [Candidatus Woesearchaeota archaeon]|nr:hypothetical protein [Candidatus Woesearchaeota archaeon]
MKSEPWIDSIIGHSLGLTANIQPLYRDRADAGEQLAELVLGQGYVNPVLIAVPMGGIPVALAMRDCLKQQLYFSFAAKIPFSEDSDYRFGMGAVAQGVVALNDELVEVLKLSKPDFSSEQGILRATEKLKRTMRELKEYTLPLPDLEGKTAILIDDGLATGYTALAAAFPLRLLRPRRLVVASPVMSDEACKRLEQNGIEYAACHKRGEPAILIDHFYSSFPKVSVSDAIKMVWQSRL